MDFFVAFIAAIVFMSFSSLELYVRSIIPWFVVLFVCVMLVLLIMGLSTKDLGKIMKPGFAWVVAIILVVIFLIVAVKVFNPVFHPDLVISSGEGTSMLEQIRGSEFYTSSYFGGAFILIIGFLVGWIFVKSWGFKNGI